MSLRDLGPAVLVAGLAGFAAAPAAAAGGACPAAMGGQALQSIDVFDGPPEELATLVPDRSDLRGDVWAVGSVYKAGRRVTLRCKYGAALTRNLAFAQPVSRCTAKRVGAVLSAACR